MVRSDIHPSLCRFHAEREAQLFGDPAPGGNVIGAALDLPELHSACRDLTSATSVNRALAQVFRLLAQRRISRQEAATFGYLAQLLLQTADPTSPPRKGYQQDALFAGNKVVPSSRERHQQDALSPAKEVQRESRDLSIPSPIDQSIHPARPSGESADPTRSSGERHQQVRLADSGGVHRAPDTGDPLLPAKEVQRQPRDPLQDAQNQQIPSLRLQATSNEQLQNC
jgi:hypothetical protein